MLRGLDLKSCCLQVRHIPPLVHIYREIYIHQFIDIDIDIDIRLKTVDQPSGRS